MTLVARFAVTGMPCVPWSVPDIHTGRDARGKRHTYTTNNPKLRVWQDLCRLRARVEMAGRVPVVGAILLHLHFTKKAIGGQAIGEPWVPDVAYRPEKGRHTKRGQPVPDLTNLIKGTEDALQESVIGDDGQTSALISTRTYGADDGVTVAVYSLEPGDLGSDDAESLAIAG